MENFTLCKGDGALFSKCRRYRYALWREWDTAKPTLYLIGLNPSTASVSKNDPTINKIVMLAKTAGAGKIIMLNLFGLISSDPKRLLGELDPLGENDEALKMADKNDIVIFCWGAFAQAVDRAESVKKLFPLAFCFGKNKDGSPKHPLYLKKSTRIELFQDN